MIAGLCTHVIGDDGWRVGWIAPVLSSSSMLAQELQLSRHKFMTPSKNRNVKNSNRENIGESEIPKEVYTPSE